MAGRLTLSPTLNLTSVPGRDPNAGSFDGDGAARRTRCEALERELTRLFQLHLGRFGDWLFRHSQGGAWRLALEVAERDKLGGEPADLEAVDALFWWSGDMRFVSRLHADRPRQLRAFETIAAITDYTHTKSKRWPGRKRGGDRKLRSFGRPPASSPTLCDRLDGWQVECRGSRTDSCEAHVANLTTCREFCEAQDSWCEAAWDDQDNGCMRADSASSACTVRRTSQICLCRDSCKDGGPWECHEEGCPARVVTCEILGVACNARFDSIWRKPPPGVGSLLVRQACPLQCGECVCERKDQGGGGNAAGQPWLRGVAGKYASSPAPRQPQGMHQCSS